MSIIGAFFLGVFCTLLFGFGFVGAFFSVLGNAQERFIIALAIMGVAVIIPIWVL